MKENWNSSLQYSTKLKLKKKKKKDEKTKARYTYRNEMYFSQSNMGKRILYGQN